MMAVVGGVVSMALGLAGVPALAQQVLQPSFKVSFAFKIADMDYPAGSYQASYRSGDRFLTFQNLQTGESAMVAFVTRLGSRKNGGVVFDKLKEGTRQLTEIYLGSSDGFLLDPRREEHQPEELETKP